MKPQKTVDEKLDEMFDMLGIVEFQSMPDTAHDMREQLRHPIKQLLTDILNSIEVPEKKVPEQTSNEAYRGMIGGFNEAVSLFQEAIRRKVEEVQNG